MVTAEAWKPEYTARAQEIWAEYERQHDLSGLAGYTAGIDPVGGKVWIGESAVEVAEQVEAEGIQSQVYLVRVGFDYYVRKGRACSSAA
jgi:hypothetical protein